MPSVLRQRVTLGRAASTAAIAALAALPFAGGAPAAHAQVVTLGQYNFTGLTGTTASVSPTSVASHITVSDLTRGGGLQAQAGTNQFNSSGFDASSALNSNLTGDFYTFTVTVDPGFTANLTGLIYSDIASATGPTAEGLTSSADGFSSVLYTNSVNTTGTDNNVSLTAYSFLQNVTGSVTFHIDAYNAASGNAGATYALKNTSAGTPLTIFGSVTNTAAPEPSSLALALLPVVPVAAVRLRRRFARKG